MRVTEAEQVVATSDEASLRRERPGEVGIDVQIGEVDLLAQSCGVVFGVLERVEETAQRVLRAS